MDNQTFLEIVKILSGSPSSLAAVLFAAVLLKKYVINGSLKRFLDLKEQEVKSLQTLEAGLARVIAEQEKLYERVCSS